MSLLGHYVALLFPIAQSNICAIAILEQTCRPGIAKLEAKRAILCAGKEIQYSERIAYGN